MDILEWEAKLQPDLIDIVDTIISNLKDGDTFVDVGANTGLLTKMVTDELSNRNIVLSKIILFEPVLKYYNECLKKFGKTITIENIALSNDSDDKVILVSNQNYGYNKIEVNGMEIQDHIKHTIKCTTFTEYTKSNNLTKVDLIKIDVEGHDCEVIEGMIEWLGDVTHKPKIIFEVGWYEEKEKDLIKKIVTELNYKVEYLKHDVLLIPNELC